MPINDELFNRELETMSIFLGSKALQSAITLDEYINVRLLQGVAIDTIREELLKDLAEGGRIFGGFRSAIRATANGVSNRMRDVAEFSEIGLIENYRWSAVLIKTCPDCVERHGQVKTWEEWEAEGMPRTGHTVCKEFCRCVLLPADTTALEPIVREKK
jgi:hypothetical protein